MATEVVRIMSRYLEGRWIPQAAGLAGPSRISISYGQPHARGRTIVGSVVPYDSVWRIGANEATELTTDLDITVGGAHIPHGAYTLFALPTKNGWQLIVSKETRQWGTDYNPAMDLVRIPLRARTLTEPLESLSIYLVPTLDAKGAAPTMPHGTLKIVWDRTELSTDWSVDAK